MIQINEKQKNKTKNSTLNKIIGLFSAYIAFSEIFKTAMPEK